MEFVLVFLALLVVVYFVTGPLRRPAASAPPSGNEEEIVELEAARDAKFREIRDAELDHGTGKLSDADFQAIDQALRAEAVEILRRLDAAHETDTIG
jgi:hypothetical protein